MHKKIYHSLLNPTYLLFWLILSLYMGSLNQPFADEAQSFLIARDASIQELFTTIARKEGTPILWFLCLKAWQNLGLGYEQIYFASIIPNLIAVGVFIYKSPFPKIITYLFPLTYFVLYQYNVIARSYSLILLFVLLAAIIYPVRLKHWAIFTAVIIGLGSITAYSFILACGIAVLGIWEEGRLPRENKERLAYGALAVFILFSIWQLWPESPNLYVSNKAYAPQFLLTNIWMLMSTGFINSYWLGKSEELWVDIGIIYFICMLIWLYKHYRAALFLLVLPNILFMVIAQFKLWHAGILIYTLCFILWQHRPEAKDRFFKVWISLFFAIQLIWSAAAINNLMHHSKYAKEAYTFLQQHHISATEVIPYNYNAQVILPYFTDKQISFWDWYENGFIRSATQEELKTYRAIIFTKEYIQYVYKGVEHFAEQNGYKLKIFPSSQFFGLMKIDKPETLYVYYRE